MQEDLAVNDTQWATILSILYVGYITYRVHVYASLFLSSTELTLSTTPGISSTIARPTSKRAVALGLINGLSQLGSTFPPPLLSASQADPS